MRSLLYLLLLLPLLVACREPTGDPERAFRLFVDRVQARDAEGAWQLLTPETQAQFSELVRLRSEASGGAIPDDPPAVILGDAQLVRPVERIEVLRSDGQSALLRVVSGETVEEVTMRRTPEGWRVAIELPPELLAPPAAGPVDAPPPLEPEPLPDPGAETP